MKLFILAIVLFACGSIALWAMYHAEGVDALRPYNLPMKPFYTAENIRNIVEHHPGDAARFVYPLLFPLDLVFLICLGGFVAALSYVIAPCTSLAAKDFWLLLVLPIAYMLCDLTENLLMTWMLKSDAGAITERFVTVVKTVTVLKHGFVWAGAVQVLMLAFFAVRRSVCT